MLEHIEAHGDVVDSIRLRKRRGRHQEPSAKAAPVEPVLCEAKRRAVHIHQGDLVATTGEKERVGSHPAAKVVHPTIASGWGVALCDGSKRPPVGSPGRA